MRGKPTRLKASLFQRSDELVYICLPEWFRDSLLSLTERMLWSRVWTDDSGNPHQLTSSDKTRIEYGIYRLMTDDCCQVDDEMINEIITRLEELENMNINVNCGCGCGCGCGQSVEDAPPPDYQETLPVTGNIPEIIEPAALAHKCNMANYLMYALRLAAIQSANFTGWYQTWADYWGDMFTFVSDPNLTKFQYQPYITIKAAVSGITNTEVITVPFDQIYNELVCAIYSAGTSQQAANNVSAMLKSAFTDYFVRSMMLEISSQLPYDIAFNQASIASYPPGFDNRDCSSCTGVGADVPVPPDGFVLIPLVSSELEFTQEGTSSTHSYNDVTQLYDYSALSGEWNADRVSVDLDSVIARTGVSFIMGAVIEIVSTDADDVSFDNLNGFPENVVGYDWNLVGKSGSVLCRYKGDEYSSNQDYKDWVDQFPEISSYGNAPQSGTGTRWKVGTHFSPKNVTYKVWFIGKV